jgi:hypothetical protein
VIAQGNGSSDTEVQLVVGDATAQSDKLQATLKLRRERVEAERQRQLAAHQVEQQRQEAELQQRLAEHKVERRRKDEALKAELQRKEEARKVEDMKSLLENATTLQYPSGNRGGSGNNGAEMESFESKMRDFATNPFEFRRLGDRVFKTTVKAVGEQNILGADCRNWIGTYSVDPSGMCHLSLCLWGTYLKHGDSFTDTNDKCLLHGVDIKLSESDAEDWLKRLRDGDRQFKLTVWYRFKQVLKADCPPDRNRAGDARNHDLGFLVEVVHYQMESE